MRLAFVTCEYVTELGFSGGLANYLGRISVALHREGHDVHVFTKSDRNEVLNYDGVTVHRVVPLWDSRMILDHIDPWIPRAFYDPYQDLKAAWCLHKCWKEEHKAKRFHVVQLANVLSVGFFFRRDHGCARIMRLSSYRPSWDTVGGTPLSIGVKLRWWMEKTAIKRIPHVYAPTDFVARLTESNYGLNHVDVIETPFFQEQSIEDSSEKTRLCGEKPYVLFFGRMTKMKGVHRLAESLPRLMQMFPEMHAVFIGNDYIAPDGGSMHHYINECLKQFPQRFVVIPAMRHDKLYPFVRGASVVVLPSIIDNLPNTCLEAMSFGRVVVATKGSCFEQLIEHEKSGLLCEPDDADSLSATIEIAWKLSPQKKEQIGTDAYNRIRSLAPDQAIPRLIDYYKRIGAGNEK